MTHHEGFWKVSVQKKLQHKQFLKKIKPVLFHIFLKLFLHSPPPFLLRTNHSYSVFIHFVSCNFILIENKFILINNMKNKTCPGLEKVSRVSPQGNSAILQTAICRFHLTTPHAECFVG